MSSGPGSMRNRNRSSGSCAREWAIVSAGTSFLRKFASPTKRNSREGTALTRSVFQNHLRPTEILLALTSLASPTTTGLRIAVAYTTFRGSKALVEALSRKIGRQWALIPKHLITSFEFGHTDPAALSYLIGIPNFSVSVASVGASQKIPILPPLSNFHPKIYLFDRGGARDSLIASANLSERALTVNTEIGVVDEDSNTAVLLDEYWASLLSESVPLTPALLDDYKNRRIKTKSRPTDPDRGIRPITLPSPTALPVFGDEVTAGSVDPKQFSSLWVEAGSMSSGGSHNQLELPRGANRFFGFTFNNYTSSHVTIGHPVLFTNTQSWSNRPLTWHGNNRMERINLPTALQGGFSYANTAVLFRQTPGGFEIVVADWSSALAVAWRNASAQARAIYKLGANTTRLCGLF